MTKLRQSILNKKDIQNEVISVKQWDTKIEVRGLSGLERAKLLNELKGDIDFEKLYPRLIILCSFDPETGDRIFEDADADLLNTKSGAALEFIAKKVMQLSGLDNDDLEKAEKN